MAKAHDKLGREAAEPAVETLRADFALRPAELGFSRLLEAGGETSCAVVAARGVSAVEIGIGIDPGGLWTLGRTRPQLALALKSGDFGATDVFNKAWSYLQ